MRWLQTEHILKGVYLGLVVYTAFQLGAMPREAWSALGQVNLCTLGGLSLALVVAAVRKGRQGFRARGRPFVFTLFLLLESPELVFGGILAGALVAAALVCRFELPALLLPTVGGAALGAALGMLRMVRNRRARLGLIVGLAAALVVGALLWLDRIGDGEPSGPLLNDPVVFAVQLLLGVPFFYILTFAGRQEESEVEIGALCAMLGLGMTILTRVEALQFKFVGFIVPLVLYFWYTSRLLTAVRVLKNVFRGLGYARSGLPRQALQAFRRALELDPKSQLAKNGYWDLHRSLDVQQLAHDPETLALVDVELCVQRASELLLGLKPTADQLEEANRLLELVLKLRPEMGAPVDYWRAVSATHGKQFADAAAALARVLDPAHYGSENSRRRAVLLPAWQLALTLHSELRRLVGEPQLAEPGRRLEAIAAVERHLAGNPEDKTVWALKQMLYHDLGEAEFNADFDRPGARPPFDFGYVEQLGLAQIEDNTRWQRGAEYLRMATRGLPLNATRLHVQIAKACQRNGLEDDARRAFERARDAGQAAGPKNLPEAERQAYFATVKYLGELALHQGDVDAALANYTLYSESERSGLETLRTLAELHERKGDALTALRVNDRALVYDAQDKDLLARKERYYYSVMPQQLQARLEQFKAGFDLDYCLRRAKAILDGRQYEGLEWLDVAQHLAQLALVVKPESLAAQVLLARTRLRYGEREEATALLEKVHAPKPEKFAGAEDEEAWFSSCQLLADLYLEASRADLAVPCLVEYRKSTKSGARTLFKLAQAYEQVGDTARAAKYYQQVTAYEGNPLTYEAQDALARLETR